MAALPQPQHSTVIKIYEHYEKAGAVFKPRPHLGASIVGNKCERAIWYSFRWATKASFLGRMLRLFESGNREEFRLAVDLRNAGVTVLDKDPASGKQYQFFDHGGHFSGSMDGALQGLVEAPKTWHVFEAKTHNTKSFEELKKKGVKEAKPLHWRQMNVYMGWSGMERAAYFAVCKDTDEIYLERVEFDKAEFERDRAKAKRVIDAAEPLTRISSDPSWYECKFCDHHAVCHVGRVPMVTCRSCVHSTPATAEGSVGGPWTCGKHNKMLSFDEQVAACPDHLFIPTLLGFAEVLEAGEDWVAYRNRGTGKPFVNCAEGKCPEGVAVELNDGSRLGIYSSKELHACEPHLVGNPVVDTLKNDMDGKVVA